MSAIANSGKLIIVDVGASGGADPRWEMSALPSQKILFEPDPREFSRLKAAAGSTALVLQAALGEKKEKADFYLCAEQENSSLLKPNLELLSRFPNPARFAVQRTLELELDSLDHQLEQAGVSQVDFIKLDTQGTELPILKGGLKTLEKVMGLQVEVSFVSLYQNQPLFTDINNFLTSLDFELFDIKRSFWVRDTKNLKQDLNKGQLLFGDALYFRTPEAILSQTDLTPERVIKAASVYLAYGYTDLAEVLRQHCMSLNQEQFLEASRIVDQAIQKSRRPFSDKLLKMKGRRLLLRMIEKAHFALKDQFTGWNRGTDEFLGNDTNREI